MFEVWWYSFLWGLTNCLGSFTLHNYNERQKYWSSSKLRKEGCHGCCSAMDLLQYLSKITENCDSWLALHGDWISWVEKESNILQKVKNAEKDILDLLKIRV